MMKILKKSVVLVPVLCVILAFVCLTGPVRADSQDIDPSSYPQIGDKEMGQLRWILSIADQDLLDFSGIEAPNQAGMGSYRYSIAFMTYFLAIEQYHKLPACPEIIKPRMDRLISKMIQKPVWEFWAVTSQGVPPLEPLMNRPYPEFRDPVGKWNIMYSGHLGHMIGLYETLYRDLKWDNPGAITFIWDDTEKYVYDNHLLQKVMYDQMRAAPNCIPCEPNACFPECNQHPVLSFILYDHIHNTNLSEANEDFLKFFLEKKMIDPRNHEAAAFYLVKQDIVTSYRTPRFGNAIDLMTFPALYAGPLAVKSASADGWTGTFMHAWQPLYIERHYPYQKDRHFKEMENNTGKLKYDPYSSTTRYGFFAMLASEVGDTQARDKLLAYCDKLYNPVYERGAFHYPINMKGNCSPLTGKLLAFARANPPNGQKIMHNQPFGDTHFNAPKVVDVDFPKVVLRRAIHDPAKNALILTTEPGTADTRATQITIINLDPGKTYSLTMDGKAIQTYRGKKQVTIEVDLSKKHDFILRSGG